MHGERNGWSQVQLIDLTSHITGDKFNGGLHFRHDTLRFLDALQAALAEAFLLGHGANRIDLSLNVSGNESAVSTHATLEIDKMVVVANATDMLLDLLALPSKPLVFPTGRLKGLFGLPQAHGVLCGPARSALFGLVTRVYEVAL